MLQPIPYVAEKGFLIKAFCKDGKPCYEGKSSSSHIWWDICDCEECKEESIDDDDQPRGRKKKLFQQSLKERYEAGDPEGENLLENLTIMVFYPKTKKQKPQSSPPSCKESKPKQDPNHEPKPPLIPYYQNILPQLRK